MTDQYILDQTHLAKNDYQQVIHPLLRAIFGQITSDANPILGTTGTQERFVLEQHELLLNSLDIRGDIEFVLAPGLDHERPVLIYILTDLKLADRITLTTSTNLTLRASRVFGTLTLIGTAGTDGADGQSYRGDPMPDALDGGSPTQRGAKGANAKDPTPIDVDGKKSSPGGEGIDGTPGLDGLDGANGGDGGDGTDGNALTIWIERFETGGLQIASDGGNAGSGGWGQTGGNGGDGGNGGTGGQGGNASNSHRASMGGRGGNGKNGGDGGNGGLAGRNGTPGQNGICRSWGPLHQNAKPPSSISVPSRPGDSVAYPPRHGAGGRGGAAGRGGRGGGGGLSSLFHSEGKLGPRGDNGDPGRDGRAFSIPIPAPEAELILPDVDFGKHPSAEYSVLIDFVPVAATLVIAPKSTVIDDWGDHAFFQGMPFGSLGPDYVFNAGRSTVRWSDGADLMIAAFGGQLRGLLVSQELGDFDLPFLEVEIYCPTLLVQIKLTSGNQVRIEKGSYDAELGSTAWDPQPLLDTGNLDRDRPLLYTYEGALGPVNRLRFFGTEVLIHNLLVSDCALCRTLPDC